MAFKQSKHLEGAFIFQVNLQNNIYWHEATIHFLAS